jgi:hypothetical protein
MMLRAFTGPRLGGAPLSSHRLRSDIATESIATNALNGIRNVSWTIVLGVLRTTIFRLQLSDLYFKMSVHETTFTLGVVGHFRVAVRNPKQKRTMVSTRARPAQSSS